MPKIKLPKFLKVAMAGVALFGGSMGLSSNAEAASDPDDHPLMTQLVDDYYNDYGKNVVDREAVDKAFDAIPDELKQDCIDKYKAMQKASKEFHDNDHTVRIQTEKQRMMIAGDNYNRSRKIVEKKLAENVHYLSLEKNKDIATDLDQGLKNIEKSKIIKNNGTGTVEKPGTGTSQGQDYMNLDDI